MLARRWYGTRVVDRLSNNVINSKSCSIPSVVELMQLSGISYRSYMRRMQSTTRSPIFTEFAETLTVSLPHSEGRVVHCNRNTHDLFFQPRGRLDLPQHSRPCRPGSIMTGRNVDGLSVAQLQINKLDLFNSFGPSSHPRAIKGTFEAKGDAVSRSAGNSLYICSPLG